MLRKSCLGRKYDDCTVSAKETSELFGILTAKPHEVKICRVRVLHVSTEVATASLLTPALPATLCVRFQ